jgi:hypothetical protein
VRRLSVVFLVAGLVAPTLFAGVFEVPVKLPVKAKLDLSKGTPIAVAPFVIAASAEDRKDRASRVDVMGEFARFARKGIEKETDLKVIVAIEEKLPTSDLRELIANRDFWKAVARRSGADYVVSGSIDFDIEDKAGYRTEEYLSPVDGRTYYRQVLVESTGFVFDVVVLVFDGVTGEKLVEENYRDFKEYDERNYDELVGLFENLRSMEKKLLGIFTSQETTSTRYLFE